MKFSELSFRDIYHKFLILTWRIDKLGDDEGGCMIPEESNAVLVYPYIDRTAGLSLDVLAPAVLPSGKILHDYALIEKLNRRYTIRSGALDEVELAIPDDPGTLREIYAEHCRVIDEGYSCGADVEATRQVDVVDHLRHENYPDDVQVALFSEDGAVEIVWVRLEGIAEQGYLYGELLNQPYGDYEVVAGDVLALGLTKDNEGIPRLFTQDSMIVDHRGRRRNEEFMRCKSEGKHE